jgi:hypothetical protein
MHALIARTVPLFALAALSIAVSVQVGCSKVSDDSMSDDDNITGYGYGHHGYGTGNHGSTSSSGGSGSGGGSSGGGSSSSSGGTYGGGY